MNQAQFERFYTIARNYVFFDTVIFYFVIGALMAFYFVSKTAEERREALSLLTIVITSGGTLIWMSNDFLARQAQAHGMCMR